MKKTLLAIYDKLYEQSGSDIIQQFGKRYSDYRKRMSYTQKEVSEKSGLSIFASASGLPHLVRYKVRQYFCLKYIHTWKRHFRKQNGLKFHHIFKKYK